MNMRQRWDAVKAGFEDRMPHPMAAPESDILKRARKRIMIALTALALLCSTFGFLGRIAGALAIALIVGLAVFLMIQVPVWLLAKHKADDAWLMRERDDA